MSERLRHRLPPTCVPSIWVVTFVVRIYVAILRHRRLAWIRQQWRDAIVSLVRIDGTSATQIQNVPVHVSSDREHTTVQVPVTNFATAKKRGKHVCVSES